MADHKDPKDGAHRQATAVLTRGFDPRLSLGSARPAVFRSSTYVFSSPEAAERAFDVATGRAQEREGEDVELIYSRISHPNAQILEEQIVPLERGAKSALVFNSGMAAIMTALMTFLRPGDTVVYTKPLYGGSMHLIHDYLSLFGVSGIGVAAGRSADLDSAIRGADNLGVVFLETPANPTMTMVDIRRAAATAAERARRPLIMVDNTFLGPIFQHPLTLGADLILYSATKFLSGFSDMLGGVALARDPALIQQMRGTRILFGNILQPDECWLMDGRLPTVSLRMNKQSKNAQRVAERLARHPRILAMHYPTLFTDAEQIRIRLAQCEFPLLCQGKTILHGVRDAHSGREIHNASGPLKGVGRAHENLQLPGRSLATIELEQTAGQNSCLVFSFHAEEFQHRLITRLLKLVLTHVSLRLRDEKRRSASSKPTSRSCH